MRQFKQRLGQAIIVGAMLIASVSGAVSTGAALDGKFNDLPICLGAIGVVVALIIGLALGAGGNE